MTEKEPTPITATKAISNSVLGISLFAILAAGVIALTQVTTSSKIEANIREAQSRALYEIYPATLDPKLYEHRLTLNANELNFDRPVDGFQAIVDDRVHGVILPVRTKEGYSGDIDLLVGINNDGKIASVRVISHTETPGLGDKIELAKSEWILSFNGQSRTSNKDPRWAVKRDGGQFDQFTGATITPRAVVAATAIALNYFERHRNDLLQIKGALPDEQ